jgi:hypothetical protein
LAMAIAELAMAGERPPDLLQDGEKQAALELAQVTDELRAAMAELAERSSPGKDSKSPSESESASDSLGVVLPLKRRRTTR